MKTSKAVKHPRAFACEPFLRELVALPTPGTREDAGQKLVRARLAPLCDRVDTDIYGNVLGVVNEKAPTRLLVTAHVDEIGLMVTEVDDKGFIYVTSLGGSRPDALVGQRVVIHGGGGPVPGVVGRKTGDAPKEEITVDGLWLDIGAGNGKEAKSLVAPGDTVTIGGEYTRLAGDRVTARALDDRAGVAAVVRAMEILSPQKKKLKVAVYALSAVQEEGGGHRGAAVCAFAVKPQAALAVDLCYATDCPKTEARKQGAAKLGGGPVLSISLTANRVVNSMLEDAAKARRIPLQKIVEPRATWTDGDAIASSCCGVATGVVSIPARYMHSTSEVLSLSDLDRAAELVAEFALRLPAAPDFRPI